VHLETFLLLLAVAVAAGWVDAVVGGGGLILLPALMLGFPGISPATAIGTNKVAAIAGTTSAAISFARRTKIDWRTVLPATALAAGFAGLGALVASSIPAGAFRPVTMALLLLVLTFVVLRPSFGTVTGGADVSRRRRLAALLLSGVAIGFYDGAFGPGTGTFLIIAFTALLSMDFVTSSAMAKFVNVGTGFGALVVFSISGHVIWYVGLSMAVCNIIGAQLGARTALRRGAGFVRVVLVVAVSGMVIRLGFQYF
jgi:hypothetical protein